MLKIAAYWDIVGNLSEPMTFRTRCGSIQVGLFLFFLFFFLFFIFIYMNGEKRRPPHGPANGLERRKKERKKGRKQEGDSS